MQIYVVGLRLHGESGDEIIDRISAWDLDDDEGVLSISSQPEMVQVPESLSAVPPGLTPAIPPAAPTPPVQAPPSNGN
jgi:hypothetical protein